MIDIPYILFGKRIKRRLANLDYRPNGFDGMHMAFNGPDGYTYYSWPDVGSIPACRIKEIERCLQWLDARTTKKSLEDFEKDLNASLIKIVSEKKEDARHKMSAHLSALYGELLMRGREIIPEELYYDIAAICCVRETEDPGVYDLPIHESKIKMLRDAGRAGASFFLNMPPLRQLLNAWLTSEEGLNALLMIWMMDRERKELARIVLSFDKG